MNSKRTRNATVLRQQLSRFCDVRHVDGLSSSTAHGFKLFYSVRYSEQSISTESFIDEFVLE